MNPWIDVAGWTLVHFLWEGAGIAAVALALLWSCRDRSPQTRYAIACAALVAMLAAPFVTAAALSRAVVVIAPAEVPRTAEAQPDTRAIPEAASLAINALMARNGSSIDVRAGGSSAWLPLVVMLWIAGVAALLIRLLGGWWRITRLHRAARAAAPSAWTAAAARIAATLGLSRRVHVVDTSLVDTPTVIGWLKPVILLPIAALAGLSPTQVEAILAHELAHVRRHDFLVNLLQTFAETVLFYHPAVWWLSARIRAEREHCCDLVALSVCGDAVSYAEALVELESWRTVHSRLAVAATGGTLLTRVRRLLGAPADDAPRSVGAMLIVGVAALVICVAGASHYLLAAQPDDAATPRVAGDARDPAPWSMTFNHNDSTMRFIGFRGRDLIRFAYQIPEARIIGGPRWLDEQILQIVVNLDAAPRADEMPGIVRQALEERLQLKTHMEKRNFPALALVRSKADRALGPGLRTASRPCFDLQQWVAAGQPREQLPSEPRRVPTCGSEIDSPLGRTQYVAITMPQLADELRGYVRGWHLAPKQTAPEIGPYLVALKAPDILDRTGLRGRYDVEFSAFFPTAALMTRFPFLTGVFEPLGFSSIPRALEEQLGLKLVETEAPYDVIVIDSAERPLP
jgi:uncharacterized protein (TIGR03435 family)